MSGIIETICERGVERDELGRQAGAKVGGERIPYEPRELASIITLIRNHNCKRYLSIEGETEGGWRFIGESCALAHVRPISPKDARKELRADCQPYDLISIDPRGLGITADEIWKYVEGGKAKVTEFGKGAPIDYGPKKYKPGTLFLFNLTDQGCKDLYFQKRSQDNKLSQSMYAGMIKWAY